MLNQDDKPTAGRKRKTTTIIEEPINSAPPAAPINPEPPEPPNLPLNPGDPLLDMIGDSVPDEIASLLSELGDSAHKVVVYRYNKATKKMARLDEWAHSEFSLGMLADTYGGGTYRVYVFRPNGQIVGTKMVEIDEAKKPKTDPTQVIQGPQGTHFVLPPAQDNSKFLELMMAQASKSQELLVMMMTKFAESAAQGNRTPTQPSLVKDIGDVLALQKMLEGKGDPQVNSVKTALDLTQKILELTQNNGSSESGGGGFMETLTKSILPMLTGQPNLTNTILAALTPQPRPGQAAQSPQPNPPAQISQPPATPPGVPALSAPTPSPTAEAPVVAPAIPGAPGATEAVVEADDELDTLFKEMKKSLLFPIYRGMILKMASDAVPPVEAAISMMDRIPETYYMIMNDLFVRPDFLDRVVRHVPEAAPHREWLTSTVGALKDQIAEFFADDDTTTGADGQGAPDDKAPEGQATPEPDKDDTK